MTKPTLARLRRSRMKETRRERRAEMVDHRDGLALIAFVEISKQMGLTNQGHLCYIAEALYGPDVAKSLERRLARIPDISKAGVATLKQYGYQERAGELVYVGGQDASTDGDGVREPDQPDSIE